MSIWKRRATLAEINARSADNLVGHLGIRFTALLEDGLEAVMPVDERTRQPFGLLHGGASAVLAETLGSMAGYLCTEGDEALVGLEINASHLRAVREGKSADAAVLCSLAARIRSGRLIFSTVRIVSAAARGFRRRSGGPSPDKADAVWKRRKSYQIRAACLTKSLCNAVAFPSRRSSPAGGRACSKSVAPAGRPACGTAVRAVYC